MGPPTGSVCGNGSCPARTGHRDHTPRHRTGDRSRPRSGGLPRGVPRGARMTLSWQRRNGRATRSAPQPWISRPADGDTPPPWGTPPRSVSDRSAWPTSGFEHRSCNWGNPEASQRSPTQSCQHVVVSGFTVTRCTALSIRMFTSESVHRESVRPRPSPASGGPARSAWPLAVPSLLRRHKNPTATLREQDDRCRRLHADLFLTA